MFVSPLGDFGLLKPEIYYIGCGRYVTWRGSGVHLLNINPAIDSRQDYGAIHFLGYDLASRRGTYDLKNIWEGTGQGDLGPMNRWSHVLHYSVRSGFLLRL